MNGNNKYHVWITVLTATYEADIARGLVLKGYSVSAASGDSLTLVAKDTTTSLVAIKLEDAGSITEVYDDIAFVLDGIKAKFYSIIVSEYSLTSMWIGSNIFVGEDLSVDSKVSDKKLN